MKYFAQAGFIAHPAAPCPTNSMNTPMRKSQWSATPRRASALASNSPAREGVTAMGLAVRSGNSLQSYGICPRKSSPGCLEGTLDHVGMDAHRVLEPRGIAASQKRGNRDLARRGGFEDNAVAAAEVLARELEAAELVLLERIGARDVGDEIGPMPVQDRRDVPLQQGEVLRAACSLVQPHVEVARRLDRGIVLLIVHREGEDAGILPEDRGRSISLMHVQVDDRGAPDSPLVLQRADRDGDVVEDAEPLAVIRKRVMEPSSQIDADAAGVRLARRENAPAGAEEGGIHERLGVGKLENRFLQHGEGSV